MAEKPAVVGLNGDEIKYAIHFNLDESMNKSCHLMPTNSYTSFRAKGKIEILLNDYGREIPDNHPVDVSRGEVTEAAQKIEVEFNIEPHPPNILRQDTGQEVPMKVMKNGKTEIRRVKYARPRKPSATA